MKHVRIVTPHKKAPIVECSSKETKRKFNELKKQVLKERIEFIESISEDPLYVNERFEQPWKLFSKYKKNITTIYFAFTIILINVSLFSISDTLIDELINSLGSEIDFGEKSFVEDFLKQELAC